MPLTVNVEVPPRDREVLASWARSPSIRAGLAQRARIVLLAADGIGTNEIARRTGVSKPTVILWKKRYAAEGTGGLEDRPKPGKPRTTDDVAIVLATLEPPPERLGVTHWSSPAAGRRAGPVQRQGRGRVAGMGAAAVAGRELQVLHRPAAGGQGPRRHRPVPQPPGQGGRAVRGRETAGPGAGTRRAGAAATARDPGKTQPRLHPARHHHAVRRAGGGHRQGHRRLLPPAPAPSGPGWTSTPGSPSTSRPRRGRGSISWRFSSASSPGRPSAAAASPRYRTSSPRSRPSSTGGMTAATPSPGPRPPTRYSRNAAQVKEPRSHDTRCRY